MLGNWHGRGAEVSRPLLAGLEKAPWRKGLVPGWEKGPRMGRRHLGLGVIQNKLPWKGGSVWKPECTSGLAGKGASGGHSWWALGARLSCRHL